MSKFNMSFAVGAAVFGASVLFGAPAHAHIVMKGALLSRDNEGLGNAQKMFPCDGVRGAGKVYTFEPGATIKLEIDVTIPHPSYYRIAFDNEGEDNFIEPASIDPIDPNRASTGKKCLDDPNDKCGKADHCNVVSTTGGASVLWDNLNPHTSGPTSESWVVKLPDVECDNCTLQVIQVMEDTVHGAYCPSGTCMDTSLEDIYHRCIDIKLVKGAPKDAPGTTTEPIMNEGIECAKAGGTPTAGAGGAAGSSAAGSGGSTEVTPAAGTGAAGSSSGGAGSSASAGSSGSSTAGASGSAGAAGGLATQGASGTPSTAGRAAAAPPSSTGGAAGTPAATPTSGSAGKPAVASSVTAAGTPGSSTAAPAPAADSSGGCSTAAGSRDTAWGLAWSLGLLAGIVTRRKRRTAR